MHLRYGLNPQVSFASAEPLDPDRPPLRVVHGTPSYVNLLDAMAGWRLVREASGLFGRPAATSIKHTSPAGAALAGPLDATNRATFGLDAEPASAVTRAYVRARDADPKSSFGDFVAVSAPVDAELAALLRRMVSDGIIAPGYEPGTVATLAAKKRGRFLVLEADPSFVPPAREVREVYGLRLTQDVDRTAITRSLVRTAVDGSTLPDRAVDDLALGLIVLRHTQSNSVAYVRDGVTIGVGAGQQSRVDCTQLAGQKAATWWQRRGDNGPLSEVAYVSDGVLPFRDNVDVAAAFGVRFIAEPGGSIRSGEVADACAEHGITLVHTGLRLFTH